MIKFCTPDSQEKLSILLYYFSGKSYSGEFAEEIKRQRYAQRLLFCDEEEVLRKAYKEKVLQYHLALSQNLFTPDDILEELSHLKGMADSRKIRNNSTHLLQIKKKL